MANQKQAARAAAAAKQKAEQEKLNKRNRIIGVIAVVVVVGVALLMLLGRGNAPKDNLPMPTAVTGSEPSAAASISEKITHQAVIEVKDYGTITAVLYGEAAPITVANFVKLANEGFYDGLTFHRIISGFMIQGGDPLGNGTGGSGENIKGEFSLNGVDNPIKHRRGVLSMARSNAYDSASSQFFIMHQAASHLDGSYAAFGCVTEGMDVVDVICATTPVTDGNGSVAKANQPVITSIRVTEVTE
ncbi:MAG: peptidylprolyl isomerase [Aristaeellaceae bacterium]